jgi:2,4-dienoyl-CoA reductase-like NADH-dependent reductase (Old Yellow Enzyme family)
MSLLLSPLTLRGTTFRTRAWVSPMCQYSSKDGHPTDWHLVHYGSLARGGAGLVMAEATAVAPEGRISPADAGIWDDDQAAGYSRIVDIVRDQGAVPGIQLAHAGRKASTQVPWQGRGYVAAAHGGWTTVGPSPLPFGDWPTPTPLTTAQIDDLVLSFADAAERAAAVGFEVAEVHAAHGYLLHQFLSPLSNRRDDEYGGSFDNRVRLLLRVAQAVREAWPSDRPVFVRLSATDWVDGGWALADTVAASQRLAEMGIDLVDVSSGGLDPGQQIHAAPGFQVPFAAAVRAQAALATAAVGLITEPAQAEQVLADGAADAVMLARAMLRNPHWPLHAATALGDEAAWPPQYRAAARPTAPAAPRR